MTLTQILQYIYYEAYPEDYAQGFAPVSNLIANTEYNQAGLAFGALYAQMAANSSVSNVYHSAMQAWDNYVFFFYNLTTPQELPTCYDEDGGQEQIELFFIWSQTVAGSTAANVIANTNSFFQGAGGALLNDTAPIRACEDQTQDQQNLNTAVGVDLHSQEFFDGVQTYIQNNVNTYMLVFNQMYTTMEQNDPGIAGVIWAEFVQLVAASMNNSEY